MLFDMREYTSVNREVIYIQTIAFIVVMRYNSGNDLKEGLT